MMKKLICAVLVFAMVFGNASVCHAQEKTDAVEKINTELYAARATGHFSFSVKAQGSHYIENVMSLEACDTVRIVTAYSSANASIYIGLVDENGKFYYARATNGKIDITIEIEKRGSYRLAVVNNSASVVSVSGYVYY